MYCIHRQEDDERLIELNKEFESVGISPMFVEPEAPHSDFKESRVFNSRMNSLRETTIKIIKKAKADGLPYVTIMEDDCKFNVTDYKFFQEQELPENFDFIHLNIVGNTTYGMKLHNKVFRQLQGGCCCQYYIVGESIYDYYLAMLEDNHVPIDEVTRYLHRKRMNSYVVDPHPVYHKIDRHSTLKDKIVNY